MSEDLSLAPVNIHVHKKTSTSCKNSQSLFSYCTVFQSYENCAKVIFRYYKSITKDTSPLATHNFSLLPMYGTISHVNPFRIFSRAE
jgi:hypothetical protein